MTEDQKKRYRDLLSKKAKGEKVDFHAFQKEVEEEKLKKIQESTNWLDRLSGSFFGYIDLDKE